MNNFENKIVNNIINISIKKTKTIDFNTKDYFTFILTDKKIKWKETPSDSVKTIAVKKSEEDSWDEYDKNIIDENTIKVKRNNINQIVVIQQSSENDIDEEKTKELRLTMSTFFDEGGKNLHLVIYKENYKLNENYKYRIAINLIEKSERKTKIENLIQNNGDIKIYWILSEESNYIERTKTTFYLVVNNNLHWLSHTAAYLSQLSLSNEVKDYCYSITRTIVPPFITNIDETDQKWKKNYIVNIANQGIVLGGELRSGENLVNEYVIDMFEEKVKIELLNILINKPKRSEITSIIYNKLIQLCNNLQTIGAIERGIYNGVDNIVNYNGKEYLVVENKELLENGYKVNIVDILDTTEEDYNNHIMTPINIVLLTQKQIRFIKLNMEVN